MIIDINSGNCLEPMISFDNLSGNVSVDSIINSFEKGEKETVDFVSNSSKYLSIGIINTVSILDPGALVVYSDIFGSEGIKNEVRKALINHLGQKGSSIDIKLLPTPWNKAVGPIALAYNNFFKH